MNRVLTRNPYWTWVLVWAASMAVAAGWLLDRKDRLLPDLVSILYAVIISWLFLVRSRRVGTAISQGQVVQRDLFRTNVVALGDIVDVTCPVGTGPVCLLLRSGDRVPIRVGPIRGPRRDDLRSQVLDAIDEARRG